MGTFTINNEGCSVPLETNYLNGQYTSSPDDCSGLSYPFTMFSLTKAYIKSNYLDSALFDKDIQYIYITGKTGSSNIYFEYNGSPLSAGDTVDFSNGDMSVIVGAYNTSDTTAALSFQILVDDYTPLSDVVTFEYTMTGCTYTTTTTTLGSTTTTTPYLQVPYNTSHADQLEFDGNTISATAGSGMSVGDIIFAYAITIENNSGINNPSGTGWNELYGVTNSSSLNSWKVWYKIAELADLTATTTVTFEDTSALYLSITSFSCKSSSPYISTVSASNYFSVEKNSSLSPTLVSGVQDSLLVVFTNLIANNHASQYTSTITSGWSLIEGNNLGNWWRVGNYYKWQETDGTTETCNITASKNIDMQALLVQILPYIG